MPQPQPRPITEVLDACLKLIPEDQTVLRADLEKIKRDVGWRAPEQMYLLWGKFGEALEAALGDPGKLDADWKKEVLKAFTGQV